MERSDTFAQRTQRAARGIASGTVVTASRSAVQSVAAQTEAGFLAEASHDVAAIRQDGGLLAGLGALAQEAAALVRDGMQEALADGYRSTAETEGAGLGLVVVVTDADLAALRGWPVVEATADEWAQELAGRLAWRVRGVATRAALGAIQPAAIPDQIDQAAVAWSNEVGRLVGDAWHAGRTAARQAMAAALRQR